MSKMFFGCGTGRCGTVTLSKVLNRQKGLICGHERRLPLRSRPPNFPAMPWERDRLQWENVKHHLSDFKTDMVGHVASWWLPYVPWIMAETEAVVVCLERDREEVVRSFEIHTVVTGNNPWTRGAEKPRPLGDGFPKFNAPKREALGLYWDLYKETAKEYARVWPDRFRRFPTDTLNSVEGVHRILDFCRWTGPRHIISGLVANKGSRQRAVIWRNANRG